MDKEEEEEEEEEAIACFGKAEGRDEGKRRERTVSVMGLLMLLAATATLLGYCQTDGKGKVWIYRRVASL